MSSLVELEETYASIDLEETISLLIQSVKRLFTRNLKEPKLAKTAHPVIQKE